MSRRLHISFFFFFFEGTYEGGWLCNALGNIFPCLFFVKRYYDLMSVNCVDFLHAFTKIVGLYIERETGTERGRERGAVVE